MRLDRCFGKKNAPVAALIAAMAWIIAPPRESLGQGGIPCHYEVVDTLPLIGGCQFGPLDTIGVSISLNGRYVCGYYGQCDDGFEAFVYDTTTHAFMTLPRPPGVDSSRANDVNDDGKVVGEYSVPALLGYRGFLYDIATGQYLQFDPLPDGAWSGATGINNAGAVCGWRSIGSRNDPLEPITGFVWTAADGIVDFGLADGKSTKARDINESGVITGSSGGDLASNFDLGFVYQNNQLSLLPPIPGGASSFGLSINDAGDIAGFGQIHYPQAPFWSYRAFIRINGQMTTIEPYSGYRHSQTFSITPDSVVLGISGGLPGNSIATKLFFWQDGVMVDPNDLVNPNLKLLATYKTSDDGILVAEGKFTGSSSHRTVLLAPTWPPVGDIVHSCTVDVDDLFSLINDWGKTDSPADLDHDGVVSVGDLVILLDHWT